MSRLISNRSVGPRSTSRARPAPSSAYPPVHCPRCAAASTSSLYWDAAIVGVQSRRRSYRPSCVLRRFSPAGRRGLNFRPVLQVDPRHGRAAAAGREAGARRFRKLRKAPVRGRDGPCFGSIRVQPLRGCRRGLHSGLFASCRPVAWGCAEATLHMCPEIIEGQISVRHLGRLNHSDEPARSPPTHIHLPATRPRRVGSRVQPLPQRPSAISRDRREATLHR